MGRVRVKVDTRKLKRNLEKLTPALNKATAIVLPKLVVGSIQKGISPVKGQGRFQKYSQSYQTAIKKGFVSGKRARPVNLTLTGQMLKSVRGKANSKSASVFFLDEKAEFHNKLGAGKSKTKRRMLPTEPNEEFNNSINLRLREVVTGVINKILG